MRWATISALIASYWRFRAATKSRTRRKNYRIAARGLRTTRRRESADYRCAHTRRVQAGAHRASGEQAAGPYREVGQRVAIGQNHLLCVPKREPQWHCPANRGATRLREHLQHGGRDDRVASGGAACGVGQLTALDHTPHIAHLLHAEPPAGEQIDPHRKQSDDRRNRQRAQVHLKVGQ